jgi:hypothetical protein
MKQLTVLIPTLLLLSGCQRLALPKTPAIPYLYSSTDYARDLAVYDANAPFSSDTAKQSLALAARNSIAFGLMGVMDDLYNQYSANLYSNRGAMAITGDGATLGLTTAVTAVRSVATKTLLGALGAAVAGVNLSVDKNLFAQQTYSMIALAMETRRTQVYSDCWNGLNNLSVQQYPLSAVKRELILYFYAGSLPGALQELQKESAAASAEVHGKKPVYNTPHSK